MTPAPDVLIPLLLTLKVAGWATLGSVSPADLVPARWNWTDPRTLDLLAGTPVNCLLLKSVDAMRDLISDSMAGNVDMQDGQRGILMSLVQAVSADSPGSGAARPSARSAVCRSR